MQSSIFAYMCISHTKTWTMQIPALSVALILTNVKYQIEQQPGRSSAIIYARLIRSEFYVYKTSSCLKCCRLAR